MSDAADRLAGLDPDRLATLADARCGGCGWAVNTAGRRPEPPEANVGPWWCQPCGGPCPRKPLTARPRPERPADQHPDLPVGYVKQAVGLGYFVKSRSTEGAWWLVVGRTCSCPAGQAGRLSCWHRRQVEQFCRELDRSMARPAGKPAPAGFFVD